MARKTKAEFAELVGAAEEERRRAEAATYPERLMALLERAVAVNFELTVKNSMFVLYDQDDRPSNAVTLSFASTDDSNSKLDSLTWEVDFKEKEQLAAEELRKAKAAALAKLTDEERKLLGL